MDQDQVQRVGLLPANQVKLVKTNRGLTKAFISRTIIQSRAWYLYVCRYVLYYNAGWAAVAASIAFEPSNPSSYSCSNWEASAFGLQDKCVSSSLFLEDVAAQNHSGVSGVLQVHLSNYLLSLRHRR